MRHSSLLLLGLLGLLVGLATADGGVAGDASGSDSVTACIDLDWHSKEAALSAAPGSEMVAGDTSQACGAGRITLTDVQRKIYDRGCPSGPQKTGSACCGCRGGDCGGGGADKMTYMSVQDAGTCAAVSRGRHGPNASASLDDDAYNKEKGVMNVCMCLICDSWHNAACCACRDNKWSDYGGSAHAWDEGVALYPLEESFAPLAPAAPTAARRWRPPGCHARQSRARREMLLRTGARDSLCAIVDRITTLMTMIQRGPLHSEHKGCAAGADRSEENAAAEENVFTAAVLPLVRKCNVAAAKTISDEMKFGLYFPTHYPSDSTLRDECQRELFPSVGSP